MPQINRTVAVEGGRYRNNATGTMVNATCWQRDGDHPGVERYPIEGRDYKGLLVVSSKEKYGLRFGDWIVETPTQTYVVAAEAFAAQYQHAPD